MNVEQEMRIGDAERETAASTLGDHFAAGRLTKQEYDERLEVVWGARTASELRPLFGDLPSAGPAGGAVRGTPGGTARPVVTRRTRRRRPPWAGVPVLPLLLAALVAAVVLSEAWWLLFVFGWLFFCGSWGHRRSC